METLLSVLEAVVAAFLVDSYSDTGCCNRK